MDVELWSFQTQKLSSSRAHNGIVRWLKIADGGIVRNNFDVRESICFL